MKLSVVWATAFDQLSQILFRKFWSVMAALLLSHIAHFYFGMTRVMY
jgi:hypothetical protein